MCSIRCRPLHGLVKAIINQHFLFINSLIILNRCNPNFIASTYSSMNNMMISNPSNQGNSLLEEWPISGDQSHPLLVEWPQADPPSLKKKVVTFSEYSEAKVLRNHSYPTKKSYSKDDYDIFKRQVSLEASNIENLISRFKMPTGRAIHSALGYGLIKHENLVGLEHLVTSAAREEYVHVRKYHSALVLRAQKLLQEKREDSVEVAAMMLAKAASISSTRCTKKAMLRAEMSLKAPEGNNRDRAAVHRKGSSNGSSWSKEKKASHEKHAHFRVPSVDSLKITRAHAAKAKSSRVRSAFAA